MTDFHSLRYNTNTEFKTRYKNLDALFIDDFIFLRNKQATQEELCCILAELSERKAFVCIALENPESLNKGFSDKLVNRIQGIQIDITNLGFETKRNKIMQIFEKTNCLVKGDLVNYLANRDISMNKLIGVCQKIILMKQLKDKDCMNLDIDDIKELIS